MQTLSVSWFHMHLMEYALGIIQDCHLSLAKSKWDSYKWTGLVWTREELVV